MMRDNYMTTGEFAKIMGVTKHTLFHYDKIRLFCPEIVTEQDYRYYSMDQMEAFNTILLLKDLGMSLEEIKEFLVDRSTEKFLDVFAERENQIDAQIKKLQATKKWIAQRKKKLMLASQQDWNWVGIRTFPARYYLLRQVEDTSSKSFHKKINELIVEFEAYGTGNDYDIAYFQHGKQVENGIYDAYDNIALLLGDKPPQENYAILPEGKYLTAYHIGTWQTVGEAYERLSAYRKEHGILTEHEYTEYYVVDNFTAESIQDYVTEIIVRIIEE